MFSFSILLAFINIFKGAIILPLQASFLEFKISLPSIGFFFLPPAFCLMLVPNKIHLLLYSSGPLSPLYVRVVSSN